MTDEMLRLSLLNAVRVEYRDILDAAPDDLPAPSFSAKYRHRMEKLLKNPFRVIVPQWQRALRTVAMFLLVLGLTFALLWVNPDTRAWIEKYFRTHRDDVGMDEYSFHGREHPTVEASAIRPTYLPEGYVEVEVKDMGNDWNIITYENENDDYIRLDIMPMEQGGGILFDTDHSVRSEITVKGIKGQLYTAISSEYNNRLILFDEVRGYCYFLVSVDSAEVLIDMAESLSWG